MTEQPEAVQDEQQIVDDAQRVYNLTLELAREKRNKRQAVQMHNQELRRIQAEIDEILSRHNENENAE